MLQRSELFVYLFKDQLDAGSTQPRLRTRDGGWCLHVHTRGVLLREPREQLVADRLTDLKRLWRWKLSDDHYVGLLVNPGTPPRRTSPAPGH